MKATDFMPAVKHANIFLHIEYERIWDKTSDIPVSHPPMRANIQAAAIVADTMASCHSVERLNSSLPIEEEKIDLHFFLLK